jgi:putative membrane protein
VLNDFLLASAHHLLVFGLIAMLVAQSALLGGSIDGIAIRRLAGIDRGYGITAGLLIVAGLARVFHGLKGSDFYLHNPWFHAKIGAFLLAALVSLWPTLCFLRWRRALRADPAWRPALEQAARLRRIVRIELALIAVILICAAAVPRHGGLSF